MKLPSSGNQSVTHPLYRADGAIVSGGTAQLVLARSYSRCMLYIENTSAGALNFEIGVGAATAVLTSDVVTSINVVNAGFGFTKPPLVRLLGGGMPQVGSPITNTFNTSYLGLGQPNA